MLNVSTWHVLTICLHCGGAEVFRGQWIVAPLGGGSAEKARMADDLAAEIPFNNVFS